MKSSRPVVQSDELVEFFTGMFDVTGITIEETGEDLTVRVGEGKVHIDPDLPDGYDFLVTFEMANVKNLVSHAADGRLDAFETWRIAAVLFTPLTRETLKNAVTSKGILRKLAGIEDLTAVENADGSVTLTWDAPGDDSVTGYRILRRNADAGEHFLLNYVPDTGSGATSYTDTDVAAGAKYVYRVKAINEAGVGPKSRRVVIITSQ